jgi:hypothetical protein
MKVDFPPMFGPVRMMNSLSSSCQSAFFETFCRVRLQNETGPTLVHIVVVWNEENVVLNLKAWMPSAFDTDIA